MPIAVAGQHVREEDDRLVVTPAADAVVDHEGDCEAEPDHHRHRQQELEVVEEGLTELRVVDHPPVVVEPDPDRRREVARVEAFPHDLHERIAERKGHRAEGGQDVEIGPEHPPPASPTAGAFTGRRLSLRTAHF